MSRFLVTGILAVTLCANIFSAPLAFAQSTSPSVRSLRITTYLPEFSTTRNLASATVNFKAFVETNTQFKTANTWFEWGETTLLNKRTSSRTVSGTREVRQTVRDLDPNAVYYVRAAAQDPTGTWYGDVIRFRVSDGVSSVVGYGGPGLVSLRLGDTSLYHAPKVDTKGVFTVSGTTAILNASVYTGASLSTSGYFRWGPTPALENQTPVKQLGASPSMDFSDVIYNLTPNTIYYYRAISSNLGGTTQGGVLSFITPIASGGTIIPLQPSVSSYAPIPTYGSQPVTGGFQIGTRVEVDTPFGKYLNIRTAEGSSYGRQSNRNEGIIIAGPVTIRGGKSWHVDFISGADGFAREEYLVNLSGGGIYTSPTQGSSGGVLASPAKTSSKPSKSATSDSGKKTDEVKKPVFTFSNLLKSSTTTLAATDGKEDGSKVAGAQGGVVVSLSDTSFFPKTLLGWLFVAVLSFMFVALLMHIASLRVQIEKMKEENGKGFFNGMPPPKVPSNLPR